MSVLSRHPGFAEALRAVDGGDVTSLIRLLDADPDLIHARATTSDPPYDGYFAGATLLHHVAGNPWRGPLPEQTVEVTRTLLQRGADPDATCGGGPAQPESGGGTTLGLVASGSQAHIRGFSADLVDALLEAGARLDASGTGGTMWMALYHTVEHRGQREVATLLHQRGHQIDLCYAAGLGLVAEVRSRLRDGPGTGDRLYRHHRRSGETSAGGVLHDALTFAAVNGRVEVAKLLLDAGASINGFRPWGPEEISPLHGAAWAGWPEMVEALLAAGADSGARDPNHAGTPLGWAVHCRRHETAATLRRAGSPD